MIPVRAPWKYFRRRLARLIAAATLWASAASAGQVWLLDGRTLEGELRFNETGALVVRPAQGEAIAVELNKVSSATFASGSYFSSGSMLPNGWTANDYGENRGSTRLDTNTFSLRVAGLGTNATACHFVSRAMPSDGEIIVRVEDVSGTGLTHAGIMIRAHHSGAFAALSLGSDGKVWFQRRVDGDKKEIRTIASGKMSAPVWLRLRLYEKSIQALYSTEPKSWQTLATEPIKLGVEKTWRESEGELQLLRASCGVFASSRGAGTLGTARVTAHVILQQGLVGEYFADREFSNLKMARLDPQIRFDWKAAPPDPALGRTNFSVRWTGKIISKRLGPHSFHIDTPGRAQLWIGEKEVPWASFTRPGSGPEFPAMTMTSGRPTDFKLEFVSDSPAAIKLGWALVNQKPELIGMTNFHHLFYGANSPESIALARMSNAGPAVRGVMLRNGTFLAGQAVKADQSAVRFSILGGPEAPVLSSRVARLVLRPPRQPLPYDIALGRGGVFMRNGDFFESDFQGLERNTLTVSSVLFGLKRFAVEGNDALVVVLNDVAAINSGFEVRLLDGSVLRAQKVRAKPASLVIEDSILGELAIPFSELVALRQLGVTISDGASAP